MMLDLLSQEKKQILLTEWPFIKEAAIAHSSDFNLTGKTAAEFINDMRLFKAQLVPRLLSEKEFLLLKSIAENCRKPFDKVWSERFLKRGMGGVFMTAKSDSVFSEFSSRGWKIHIAFTKGREKEIARFLFCHGLYFKVELDIGTYFNGLINSGSTIYIGSNGDMMLIADLLERQIGSFLELGQCVTDTTGKKIPVGSGSDIEIRPKIMARFDIAKTRFSWRGGGNEKYAEFGFPTWTGLGGIPTLSKYDKIVSLYLNQWNEVTPEQRRSFLAYFQRVYQESKEELCRDFGKEFVLGKNRE